MKKTVWEKEEYGESGISKVRKGWGRIIMKDGTVRTWIIRKYLTKIGYCKEYKENNFTNRGIRREFNSCGKRKTGKTYYDSWNIKNMRYEKIFKQNGIIFGEWGKKSYEPRNEEKNQQLRPERVM